MSDGVEIIYRPRRGVKDVVLTRSYYAPPEVTYPRGVPLERIIALPEMQKLIADLQNLQELPVMTPIGEGFRTHTMTFHYYASAGTRQGVNIDGTGVFITMPRRDNIDDYKIQRFAFEVLKKVLRYEARMLLPGYVAERANKFWIRYNGVRVKDTLRRWGSCSSNNILSFSLFAMLLPEEFLNYLIWHELAHLNHLDHSMEFWQLLSSYLGRDARLLDDDMNEFSPSIPRLF